MPSYPTQNQGSLSWETCQYWQKLLWLLLSDQSRIYACLTVTVVLGAQLCVPLPFQCPQRKPSLGTPGFPEGRNKFKHTITKRNEYKDFFFFFLVELEFELRTSSLQSRRPTA
jgi:hypothetical protein